MESTDLSEKFGARQEHVPHSRVTEAKQVPDEPRQTTILEAFSSPDSRRQLLFAVFIMFMQMMSGVDGVLFVSLTVAVLRKRAYMVIPVCPPSLQTSRLVHQPI